MAVNWVMRSADGGFTPLPGEQRLYTSPPRTTMAIQTLDRSTSRVPYTLSSSSGSVHLTNRRIVYLPSQRTSTLDSFTAPLLNIHDSRVTAPFFGPNVWTALVQPVPGGGVPPAHAAVELKLTFKDGGAFDFHTAFERVKERLAQAVDVAREAGRMGDASSEAGGAAATGRGGDALAGVGLDAVHLDELPAYEAGGWGGMAVSAGVGAAGDRDSGLGESPAPPPQKGDSGQASAGAAAVAAPDDAPPPSEPPPGYEEVQMDSVAQELERALRQSMEES